MIPILLLATLGAATVDFSGYIESSTIANEARLSCGGEFSMGDFLPNLTVTAAYSKPNNTIGAYLDWVPEDTVWNIADPAQRNESNQSWMRQDGYINRPYLLTGLFFKHQYPDNGFLQLKFGGFLASGLQPLEGIPTAYSLSAPIPLVFAQHYDKGVLVSYSFRSLVNVHLGIIDGDYTTGEPDLFKTHNSANNSSPSLAGGLKLVIPKIPGTLYLAATGTTGTQGSYPGQKRRQDNLTLCLDYQYKTKLLTIEARPFFTTSARNPQADGSGRHIQPVRIQGYGAELVLRDIPVRIATLDLYSSLWQAENLSTSPDGELFLGNSTHLKGWTAGARFNDPGGITTGRTSYVGITYSLITVDDPDAFPSMLGQSSFSILLVSIGVKW